MQPPHSRPWVIQRLHDPEYLGRLSRADLIFGLDEETDHPFLIFGRSKLKEIAAAGLSTKCVAIIEPLLQRTDELEAFIEAVRQAKGHDEYETVDFVC